MKLLFLQLLTLTTPQPKSDTNILSRLSSFPDSPTVRMLTVYVQLPIARWPGLRRSPFTGSSGMVFIDLYASNGKDSCRQVLAFRPLSPTTAVLSNRPVTATFTDESYQYYHAYLGLSLTSEQWQNILKDLHKWARFIPYRRDSCNSTTFACELLRQVRPSLPGIHPPDCHYPADLYRWLQTLHVDVPRDDLYLDRKKRYAGVSYSAAEAPTLPHPTIPHHE